MLSKVDEAILFFINHSSANPFCDMAVRAFAKIPVEFAIILIAVIGLFAGKKYTKFSSLIFLASFAVSRYLVNIIKAIVKRPRPFETLKDVRFPVGPVGGFSFPSGHATIFFCLATVIAMRYPKMRYLSFAIAAFIAIYRLYVGVHYPSDILAGSVLGIFVGYFITKMASRCGDQGGQK